MTFIPTPFSTPVQIPTTVRGYQTIPYISTQWFRYAPTAVSSTALVPGSTNQAVDSNNSLALVISRASAMIDEYCFGDHNQTFAADLTVDSVWVKPKRGSELALPIKGSPLQQIVGIGLGTSPANIANLSATAISSIVAGSNIIYLLTPQPQVTPNIGPMNVDRVYVVYTYVTGFPHFMLAADATAGSSTIQVWPVPFGETQVWGVFPPQNGRPGTTLTIRDPLGPELISIASITNASTSGSPATLTLANPLAYNHTASTTSGGFWGNTGTNGTGPFVTGIPEDIEQATITLTAMLLKMQGMGAQVPQALGRAAMPSKTVEGYPGLHSDWDLVHSLLATYRVPYIHGLMG